MRKAKYFQPRVEVLEDRCLPSFSLTPGGNVNISQMTNVQAEGTIAIDSANPQRLFSSSVDWNGSQGLFAGTSVNGGVTWASRQMATGSAGGDSLPAALGDPQATFDRFGNLFLVYGTPHTVQSGTASGGGNTTLSDLPRLWVADMWAGCTVQITGGTGAGQTRTISSNTVSSLTVSAAWTTNPDATSTYQIDLPSNYCGVVLASSSDAGANFLFRGFVDQSHWADYPAIATGPGGPNQADTVWIAWHRSVMTDRGVFAAWAPVYGLGNIGMMQNAMPPQDDSTRIANSNSGRSEEIAVGPNGQVMVVWAQNAPADPTSNRIYASIE